MISLRGFAQRIRLGGLNRFAHFVAPVVDRLAYLAAWPSAVGTDVLLVRLDAIGDFILWSDSARRLADHYRASGRRVVLLANAAWAELADDLTSFDSVWQLNRRRFLLNPLYRFNLMRRLRRAGFDLAIQPTLSRELLLGDAVVRFSGHRHRIGSTGDLALQHKKERERANRWYSKLIAAHPGPLTELERNAEFLRGLGLFAEPRLGQLPLPAPVPPENIFVLFPGASWEGRCWSPASFAALAERISAATGWQGVVAGGKGDQSVAAAVLAATPLALDNKAGSTTLLGLATLLQRARLVVSNETSAVHLAAAVGTPSVCILGGGHFGRFLPYAKSACHNIPHVVCHPMACYGCNWHCCYPRADGRAVACIDKITVDQAWEIVKPLLTMVDA